MIRMITRYFCLFVFLAFSLPSSSQSEAESALPFDPKIDGLKLTELVSGYEAIKAINKLHGMPIRIRRGFIAHYEAKQHKATIWVSEAHSEDLADKQIRIMISKMKSSKRSPFHHYNASDFRKTKVIGFHGMGQIHYVFRINKWVYWISANEEHIDKLLGHLCKIS
ncbi:MAG: hypothetical protein JRF28_02440 [Deltaproteobacteria bacterium]|nr:hypothetical protein [Deltaproteobacteria bacterium]